MSVDLQVMKSITFYIPVSSSINHAIYQSFHLPVISPTNHLMVHSFPNLKINFLILCRVIWHKGFQYFFFGQKSSLKQAQICNKLLLSWQKGPHYAKRHSVEEWLSEWQVNNGTLFFSSLNWVSFCWASFLQSVFLLNGGVPSPLLM